MRRHNLLILSLSLAAVGSLPAQSCNLIVNGDFETGSLSPWVESGWACQTGVAQTDCAGSGPSFSFNCVHGGKSGQTRRTNGYWPGNAIEQNVFVIQGLTYLFTADIQVTRPGTVSNADAGLVEVFLDGTSVGSHDFGFYSAGTAPRAHMCFTFIAQTTGCKPLLIDFSRKYYCSATRITPEARIDNINLVTSPTPPIICPRGERKINTTVNIDINGTASANFALFIGTAKTPFGIPIPGFNGQWWLDGVILNLFGASFNAGGAYAFAPPIPNDPNLAGLLLTWQAIEAPGAVNIGEVTSFAFYQ